MSFGEDLDKLVKDHSDGLVGAHTSWKRVKLADVADLVNGFAFKSAHFTESEGTPLVRIRDILKGKPGTFYNAQLDDPKMKSVTDGELVIGMDGDFNSAIWKGGKALLNQRVCTLRTDERFFSQKLLAYVLPAYLKLINDHTSAITVKHLSSRTVQEIPLPLPPLKEQQRIVEKIETLFTRLDKGEEAVRDVQKLLTRYRQSVLKSAVTGQLTADWRAEQTGELEHGDDLLAKMLTARREKWDGRGSYKEPVGIEKSALLDLPEGWTWASFDQLICHLTSGSRDWKQYYGRGDGIFIMAQNVRPMRFDLKEPFFVDPPSDSPDAKRSEVQKDDLLITIVGANTGDICRFPTDAKAHYVCQSVALARPIDNRMSQFLEVYLASAGAGRDELEKFIYGAGRPHLSFEQLRSVPVPLPPWNEQAELLSIVSEHLDKIAKLEELCETELKRSASLRQSILKDAFAGKLVPQDPTDEPASALLARIVAEKPTAKKTRKKTSA